MGNLVSRSSDDQLKGKKRVLNSDEAEDSNKRSRFENEAFSLVKESDVGIVAFVNPNLEGFQSILKYR